MNFLKKTCGIRLSEIERDDYKSMQTFCGIDEQKMIAPFILCCTVAVRSIHKQVLATSDYIKSARPEQRAWRAKIMNIIDFFQRR